MPITVEQGQQFAADILKAFAAGFKKNNHLETTKPFTAETLSWSWSDGVEGKGPREEIMEVMAKTWGFMVDSFILPSPKVVVDTTNSRVVVYGPLVLNITGNLPDENNPVSNPICFIFTLNEDLKMCHWDAIWDHGNQELLGALGKVATKLGLPAQPEQTTTTTPITQEEGEAFAADFLKASAAGFKNNDHQEHMKHLTANKLSWNWSDGVKGEGSEEEIMGIMAKSWGFMVDSFILPNPDVVIDTTNRKVLIAGPLVINITGNLPDQNNPVSNPICFILTLDDNLKMCHWEGYWNNENEVMLAALAKVSASLEAKKTTKTVPKTLGEVAKPSTRVLEESN